MHEIIAKMEENAFVFKKNKEKKQQQLIWLVYGYKPSFPPMQTTVIKVKKQSILQSYLLCCTSRFNFIVCMVNLMHPTLSASMLNSGTLLLKSEVICVRLRA